MKTPPEKPPYSVEPSRRPNKKGAVKRQQTNTRDRQMPHREQLLDELFPPAVVAPPSPTVTASKEEAT